MKNQEQIEILCAAMNQEDFSKYHEMKIHSCDAVFANQAGKYDYQEREIDGQTVKMLTTATTGVGKNRNFALALAQGEILLLADEDLQYEKNMERTVREAYQRFPDAEMILFGIRYTRQGQVFRSRIPQTGRLSFLKALRYGTCAVSIRRKSVLKHNLRFSELFGGGCLYSYGEDTDFIVQCFRKHMNIYSYGAVIAETSKDASTCNTGYGQKYFFDKGALARHSLGIMAFPYMFRMARKKMETELNFIQRIRLMRAGYRQFPELISYDEWINEKNEKDDHCEQQYEGGRSTKKPL